MWRLLSLLPLLAFAAAENGLDGWLRYAPIPDASQHQTSVPANLIVLNSSVISPVSTAGVELQKGIHGILGKTLGTQSDPKSSIVVGTVAAYTAAYGKPEGLPRDLGEEGFWLNTNGDAVQILGQDERGALYGAFEYLSRLAQGNFKVESYDTSPNQLIRWVNQWDNLDASGVHGSVERGYGGPSIFFADGYVVQDMTRVSQYARLLASIRVNAIIVNNVNANASLLKPENIAGLGRIADAFRPYGIQIGISINFASPQTFGNLTTFDPLAPEVIKFWGDITDTLYSRIPDMVGYLVKANSEGQPGPLTYNRTLAQGANLFAKAVQPYGGLLMFRAFVYDLLNESDWRADRANAAVEFFKDLDGAFDENVIVQIKYGPIDFQVREPVSPLFSHLKKTSTAIELQVTQEYMGQQNHLVYLPPLWQTILDFDMRVDGQRSLVRDIISGKHFNRKLGGSAAVVNVGTNSTWLGSHLAMSNLYAYGRLAWEPKLDSQDILQDWIRLTFGSDPKVIDVITKMSMVSWNAYENYSGNLGIQTLTDILYTHFGPNPANADNNGYGQWTRADRDSIGMDRTVSNGTGFSGQYPPEVAAKYEDIRTTPQVLLLWFHHVPYTFKLHTGQTVIQHFYDAHYEGAATAQTFVPLWESIEGKIDSERYEQVLFRLKFQAGHSIVWRDAINNYYLNLSGIPDEAKRVGNYPYRIEAENMTLSGYKVVPVALFEMASKFNAIVTTSNTTAGTVTAKSQFPSGTYDLAVNYFDLSGGKAHWDVYVNDQIVGKVFGNNEDSLGHEPTVYLDGHSATRRTFNAVRINKGDEIKVVGTPDGIELAPLDYISILPQGIVD